MRKIYMIRHGQPLFPGGEGCCLGTADFPLDTLGRLQACQTGRTLKDVVNILKKRGPISLTVITLLDKPSRRLVDFKPDMALFTIPDHFVIGYGLDCGEYFRNLPYIAEYDECSK